VPDLRLRSGGRLPGSYFAVTKLPLTALSESAQSKRGFQDIHLIELGTHPGPDTQSQQRFEHLDPGRNLSEGKKPPQARTRVQMELA
jgi:hypothetical protein